MTIAADDPRLTPIMLRKELLASGHNEKSLAHALRRKDLDRVRWGAYVSGPTWTTMSEEQRYAVVCRAAYRQARTGVVLSHTSALPFLEAPVWGLRLDEVHLTRTDERSGRREAGVRQHSGKLLEGDTVTKYGLTFTNAARAALEVTTIGSVEAALVVVCDLLHRKLTTPHDLRQRYEETMEQWPYSLRTELVLRLADPRIETVGEARTWHFMWRHSLPKPEPQYEVYDDAGDLVARLDFALPEWGVWFEFDGKVKYVRHRKPGESVTDVVLREKGREGHVSEITGWRCIRITWDDLANPERLAARIWKVLLEVRSSRRRP